MIGSLAGIRVVDVTMSVAGPFATQILGDLGADVVKVERPEVGDDTRRWGPPFWNGESCTFSALNRNKRSVVLDLKDDAQRETFRQLLASADVFVQNLRPGSLAKMGLSYDDVRELNPRLIYCDMSGYGMTGPLAGSPAYDPLMQAFGGLMSLNGEQGRPPVRIPASILDQGTGMWTAIAVLDALRTRDRTGVGCHLHTSLLSTALMWLPSQFLGYFADGTVPERLGSGTVGIYPYAAFPTADNYIIIAAGNQNLWQRLCGAIDRPDLLDDPRFTLNPDRVAHRDELFEELAGTLRHKESEHWLDVLDAAGVPTTPIQTLDAVVAHEQVQAIGGFASVEHPRIDDFRVVNLPIQADGAYPPVRRVPPALGEHTDEVLAELGRRDTGEEQS
ncbi:CaiB/BaiF CoA transferase family protein [Planosporangium mesophilum]|uniref:CoA transferase n=1 Tax=Planosporangium mesophilum TaxID=689768 RepID=A0A8J3TFR5_9ACTN|nr:CoA transferase [Planosporangium mesophilum]NJC82956.1 CoA transferase [Planosporangium mesophilum]GII24736.1 CoA transferase [Planosporangium mesophilum]